MVVQGGVRLRIGQDGNPRDLRRDLLAIGPLSHDRRVVDAEPRDIAAGAREALHKAQPDGIDHQYENDRYRARQLPH